MTEKEKDERKSEAMRRLRGRVQVVEAMGIAYGRDPDSMFWGLLDRARGDVQESLAEIEGMLDG